jgi:hypothetical protein
MYNKCPIKYRNVSLKRPLSSSITKGQSHPNIEDTIELINDNLQTLLPALDNGRNPPIRSKHKRNYIEISRLDEGNPAMFEGVPVSYEGVPIARLIDGRHIGEKFGVMYLQTYKTNEDLAKRDVGNLSNSAVLSVLHQYFSAAHRSKGRNRIKN